MLTTDIAIKRVYSPRPSRSKIVKLTSAIATADTIFQGSRHLAPPVDEAEQGRGRNEQDVVPALRGEQRNEDHEEAEFQVVRLADTAPHGQDCRGQRQCAGAGRQGKVPRPALPVREISPTLPPARCFRDTGDSAPWSP